MRDDVVESVTLGDTLRDTSSEINEQNDENVSIYGETQSEASRKLLIWQR